MSGIAIAAFVVKDPVRRPVVRLGLAEERDLVARDVNTVRFLITLGLNAAETLGADVVARAEAWSARPPRQVSRRARKRSWALPIGCHSLLTIQ